MTMRAKGNWEHERGYRLNADGKSIVYSNENTGEELTVEAMIDEEYGMMEYLVFYKDGDDMELINRSDDKGDSLDFVEKVMDEGVENVDTSC